MGYDTECLGYIDKTALPQICIDLNVKPWKALRVELFNQSQEIEVENNRISFESFVTWWFNDTVYVKI